MDDFLRVASDAKKDVFDNMKGEFGRFDNL